MPFVPGWDAAFDYEPPSDCMTKVPSQAGFIKFTKILSVGRLNNNQLYGKKGYIQG